MKDWFKPLLVYKKYLLAEKVLKHCCGSFAWVSNSPHEEHLITEKQYPNVYLASNFLSKGVKSPIDSSRLVEAVDLLEKNKHITTNRNQNLYKFSIQCTKEGERAINEGYYKKKVYGLWGKIIGIPAGAIGLIGLIQLIRTLL